MSEVKRYGICGFEGGVIELKEGHLVHVDDFARVTAELVSANSDKEAYAQNAIDLRKRVDALQQRLTAANEREDAARAFVIRLIECACGQPSIATGYLSDILDALKPAEGRGDAS